MQCMPEGEWVTRSARALQEVEEELDRALRHLGAATADGWHAVAAERYRTSRDQLAADLSRLREGLTDARVVVARHARQAIDARAAAQAKPRDFMEGMQRLSEVFRLEGAP